jgi:hypothetical protein
MRVFEIGLMTEKAKDRIVEALDGKTYMHFRVSWGIGPAGLDVAIVTDYGMDPDRDIDTSDADILAFAFGVLAETN